ncbi:MAG: GDSL-type esterase/lipase family protein [Planctomycetota bacterium]
MKSRVAIVLFVLAAQALGAAHSDSVAVIDPSDDRILYTGRWYQENPSAPWCSWQGCSIIANFKGTSISASLRAVADGKDWVFVIIDDDQAAARTVALKGGMHDYLLASGLADTTHKVEIVKKSNAGKDHIVTFRGFKVSGPGLVSPPPRPSRKLEFYGDSNLAAYSLEHEQNKGDMKYRDSYYCLAGIASRMLDAEYHNISKGGERIHDVMTNIWDKYYPNSGEVWDFSSNRPDAVIVNLGANDVSKPKESITKAYHKFLDVLRDTHPEAHIVVMNAYGWSYEEPSNYTAEVVAARNDSNMSCLHFPWVFEQWHGCQYDHSGMANLLAEHLSEVVGWSYKPSDVMDGFGRGGNVANGSFEQVAPFGGYGWRYYTASGVSRITGADDAHGGDCYLRLENGANVHQPNPASNGDKFTVSVWMRGATDGAEGRITIEFKDQKMWTDPLDTYTAAKTLTTDWRQYSVTHTAPSGGVKPVFQIKVILQAGPGDTVCFDDVRMHKHGKRGASRLATPELTER